MKKTTLATSILAVIGTSGLSAVNAAAIGSFRITGGSFAMGFFTPAGPLPFTHTSGADLAAGYIAPTWNLNADQGGPAAGSIMSFNFGGPHVNHYTAATSINAGWSGGPVLNGTFGGGTITVDISSLFANWRTDDFGWGSPAATGTTTGGTSFDIGWTRVNVHGGPFNGHVVTYTATGTLSAVPVLATAWLMGAGLLGLAGMARRRKKT